jgi:hypothetical protein
MGAMKRLLEAQMEAQDDYFGNIVRLVEDAAERSRRRDEDEAKRIAAPTH